MCEFVSWIEHKDKVLFLTSKELETEKGKKLIKYLSDYPPDIVGHGAIREYYKLGRHQGINHECTNFSSTNNFPPEIVEAIKAGMFNTLAGARDKGLLNKSAWEEYDKITRAALEEYNKIVQSVWKEYKKIRQPAREEYEKIRQPAFWNLFKDPENRSTAWK